MDFTQDDVDSLAAKLAASDLSAGERAVLDALVDEAEGEVAGFAAPGFSFTPLRLGGIDPVLENGAGKILENGAGKVFVPGRI